MKKFTTLSGVAASLPMVNVDTDMIIPKQFLKTIKRTGLGEYLFDELRRTPDGQEVSDFVLNQDPYRNTRILITGSNFGCGSSREHAPWALADFGIRCIIAPSFADIFFNNCFKNGMLPVVLGEWAITDLIQKTKASNNRKITINLPAQTIICSDKTEISFEVDSFRKDCLLNGLDDIGMTLKKTSAISAFEKIQRAAQPWQPMSSHQQQGS